MAYSGPAGLLSVPTVPHWPLAARLPQLDDRARGPRSHPLSTLQPGPTKRWKIQSDRAINHAHGKHHDHRSCSSHRSPADGDPRRVQLSGMLGRFPAPLKASPIGVISEASRQAPSALICDHSVAQSSSARPHLLAHRSVSIGHGAVLIEPPASRSGYRRRRGPKHQELAAGTDQRVNCDIMSIIGGRQHWPGESGQDPRTRRRARCNGPSIKRAGKHPAPLRLPRCNVVV